MATVRDIAKKCSVSLGTVSRVLNNSANVKDATRQKVLDAIKELKYDPRDNTPEVQRVSLTTYGLVLPIKRMSQIGRYYERAVGSFSDNVEKYEKRCVLLHLDRVIKTVLEEGKNPRTALGVDKLVLVGINQPECDKLLVALKDWEVPCVLIRRSSDLKGVAVISDDDDKAVTAAIDHLLSLGHEGLSLANVSTRALENRGKVFQSYLKEKGIPADESRLFTLVTPDDDIESWLDSCINEKGVTGFIAGDDQIAIHILKHCRNTGVRVPEDVSVISIGGGEITGLFAPAITTVRIPLEKMIEMAVVLLNGDADFSADEQYRMEVPNELIIRETTAVYKKGE